jgi:hypothetical protein
MKYLLLAYHEEKSGTPCPSARGTPSWASAARMTRRSGRAVTVIAMEGLQPVRNATTVRVRNGKLLTGGPFAETKEQLGGFYLINARDLNETIQVASNTAAPRLGERLGWASRCDRSQSSSRVAEAHR